MKTESDWVCCFFFFFFNSFSIFYFTLKERKTKWLLKDDVKKIVGEMQLRNTLNIQRKSINFLSYRGESRA
jgi:hypothetical protein